MKRYFLTLGVLFFAGMAAQPALADSFFLIGSNSAGVPCSSNAPCAEVTITTSGDTATFKVSSLDSDFVFDTFGFNFTGAGTLSLDGAPTGEVGSSYSLANDNGSEDGWGKFDYTFTTGKNGGSDGADCMVTSGNPGTGCTFSFTVMDPGNTLTTLDFESPSSGGNGSGDFAGHLAEPSTLGATGYVGDSVPTGVVPEPSSLMLLGAGALGLAGVVRRRFTR